MQPLTSSRNIDDDDLLIADPTTIRYGSTDRMSASSPTAPAKTTTTDLEATSPTVEEHVAFIDHTSSSRVPSSVTLANKTANLVYFIFLLHGIGILMPWNMFLTIAPEYFINYKFKPLDLNATVPDYSKYFFSYLGVFSQVPNLLLNLLNLFVVLKADLSRRILYSLVVVAIICFFTIVFIFVDTHSWMFGFFALTMLSVVILNSANGVYQNSIYGMTAMFPGKYTNAVVIGNNVCGIFVSLLLIATLIFFKNVQLVAVFYFSVALIIILGCLFSFLWLPKISFYAYYTNQARLQASQDPDGNKPFTLTDFKEILRQTWKQMLSVFLTFFVTLALFPAIVSNVGLYPPDREYDFILPKYLFVPVITFLNFNVFATIGNVAANYVQWPDMDKLIWPVALRLLFIPFFLFCNYGYPRNYSVLFTNEWLFIIMLSFMSLTHGYFSSISMMYAPKAAEPAKAKMAGMMSAFFLVLGIAVGVAFTFVEAYLFLGS